MKLFGAVFVFWALGCAAAAGLGCFAFSIPDSNASPIVPLLFLVLAVLFARAGAGLWRGDGDSSLRVYLTVGAGPVVGLAAWLTGIPGQPGPFFLAIGLGSVLYATIAIAVARRAARRFGSDVAAS